VTDFGRHKKMTTSVGSELEWGRRQFPWCVSSDDNELEMFLRVGLEGWTGLSGIGLAAVTSAPDLRAADPTAVPDDMGINRLIELADGHQVIFKKVRPERVPSMYHEPFVGSIMASRGFKTLDYLGIARATDGSSWIITKYLQDYISFQDMLNRNEANLSDAIDPVDRMRVKYYSYLLGVSVRRLVMEGIDYADLDFKNVLVAKSHNRQLIFCDFERTSDAALISDRVIGRLMAAIARRLKRQRLDDEIINLMIAGAFFDPALIDVTHLAAVVAEIIRPMERPVLTVAIDGVAGAGKTTLSARLASELARLGRRPLVVETDWYVRFTRSERDAANFSVPHDQWYSMGILSRDLYRLKARSLPPATLYYDHATGEHSLSSDLALDATRVQDVIIVDGMYSSDRTLAPLIDVAIQLAVDSSTAADRFKMRDPNRSGSSAAHAARREQQINSLVSRQRIARARGGAHLVLNGGSGERYQVGAVQPRFLPLVAGQLNLGRHMNIPESCPLCPTNPLAGRFDIRGSFQAIYNIAPIVRGHVLIAPLRHVTTLLELDDAVRAEFFAYAFDITRMVLDRVGTKEFDWALQDGVDAGQTVGHLHLHILPRQAGDLNRAGSWWVSLFGAAAEAPDSSQRPPLKEEVLEAEVDWLLGREAKQQ
jgi:diadenosine tetraphosphate (Ap4A) HIT family hydrolase/uridine kinase